MSSDRTACPRRICHPDSSSQAGPQHPLHLDMAQQKGLCRMNLERCSVMQRQFGLSPEHDSRHSGPGSTVTVDRAWLESLLLDELGSRINSLSDQELMAMLEQLVRSKQPTSSQRSALPHNSQRLPNPLKGMALAWPWAQQQAPEPQSGVTNTGDSVLERLTGSLPGWLKGAEGPAPDASAADRRPAESTAPPYSTSYTPDQPQTGPSVPKAVPNAPQQSLSSTAAAQGREESAPEPQSNSGEAASPSMPPSMGSPSSALGGSPVGREAARDAARDGGKARSAESGDAAATREEDLTGSLLEASGLLPLQLREDGLPEASTAAADERILKGRVFLESARQAAGSVAAAVAAAVASGLQSMPGSNPFQGLEAGTESGLPAAVETALQIALLAGLGVGIYAMLPLFGFAKTEMEPVDAMQLTSQAEQGQAAHRLPSAWDVIKLIPNALLGLPIAISSPSAAATTALEYPPSPYDQGVIQQPPMGPPPPDRGSVFPGRQSQPVSAHSQQPDSTVLWRRNDSTSSSRQPAEPAGAAAAANVLWVRNDAGQAVRNVSGVQRDSGAADSTVLWCRDDSSAPRSLTFRGTAGDSRYSGNSRQHVMPEPVSNEADPWTAPQQPQSPDTATAEEWIRMHADLQPRGEDPWREPLGSGAKMDQPAGFRSGVGETGPAVGTGHGATNGRRYAAASGVSQIDRQDNASPIDKARARDRSVLYNNVEQVPSVRRQSAYIRK